MGERKIKYKTGDVVELNSGSPAMTVENNVDGICTVYWYRGKEKKIETFPKECLKLRKGK